MSKPIFVGLDLETTAGNQLGRICQVGVSLGVTRQFCEDVCPGEPGNMVVVDRLKSDSQWADNESFFLVETEALKVNGFTQERMAAGTPTGAADATLDTWLDMQGHKPGSLIPVGFNVAGFDMPFVRREMPLTARWFSYRSVDLNALCFAIGAESQMRDSQNPGYEVFKKRAKKYAAELMGSANWHDAGFDATAALIMFHWLHGVTL